MRESIASESGASQINVVQVGKVSRIRRWCDDRVRLPGGTNDGSGASCVVVPLISRDQTRGMGLTQSPDSAEEDAIRLAVLLGSYEVATAQPEQRRYQTLAIHAGTRVAHAVERGCVRYDRLVDIC